MKYLETSISKVKVKMNETTKNHMTILTGTLVDADTLAPVPGIIKRRHQFTTKNRIKSEEVDKVVNRLLYDYREIVSRAIIKRNTECSTDQKGIFTLTFEQHDDEKHSAFAQPNRWKQSTLEKSIATFKNILEEMDKYGINIKQSDIDSIRISLEQKALESRRSNNDIEQAIYNKAQSLKRVDCLLATLYDLNPDLPRLYFDAKATIKSPKAEAFKAIPENVRLKMILNIIENINNGLYLGIAVMLLAGPRTAEAAALNIGEIEIVQGKFAVFPIKVQLSQNKDIDDILKYEASYRVVIAPFLFVKIYELRIEYLRGLGYDLDTILSFPLVSDPQDPSKYCSPADLSELGRELLLSCGMTEPEYNYYRFLSVTEPDMTGANGRNSSVTNYICRRDFASRAKNDCGLSDVETDYLLGHKNPKSILYDFTNVDCQSSIAKKLERAILHKEYNLHPYYNPITLKNTKKEDFESYSAYKIVSGNETTRVTITQISSSEPGQKIICRTNGKIIKTGELVRGAIAVKDKCNHNPPIGTVVKDNDFKTQT